MAAPRRRVVATVVLVGLFAGAVVLHVLQGNISLDSSALAAEKVPPWVSDVRENKFPQDQRPRFSALRECYYACHRRPRNWCAGVVTPLTVEEQYDALDRGHHSAGAIDAEYKKIDPNTDKSCTEFCFAACGHSYAQGLNCAARARRSVEKCAVLSHPGFPRTLRSAQARDSLLCNAHILSPAQWPRATASRREFMDA